MNLMPLVILAVSTTLPPTPHPEEQVFERASQLVPWCRQEVEAYFVAKGEETYQITTSHKSVGRMLIVEGTIRAGGRYVPFTCRVGQGGRERYAVVEVR